MELNKLVGYKLTEIQKTRFEIKLLFKRQGVGEKLILSFDGFLFETPSPAINKKVQRIEVKNVLGFKALTELRHQKLNTADYKQLLIEMEGSTGDYKIELIGVFKKNHLSTMIN